MATTPTSRRSSTSGAGCTRTPSHPPYGVIASSSLQRRGPATDERIKVALTTRNHLQMAPKDAAPQLIKERSWASSSNPLHELRRQAGAHRVRRLRAPHTSLW